MSLDELLRQFHVMREWYFETLYIPTPQIYKDYVEDFLARYIRSVGALEENAPDAEALQEAYFYTEHIAEAEVPLEAAHICHTHGLLSSTGDVLYRREAAPAAYGHVPPSPSAVHAAIEDMITRYNMAYKGTTAEGKRSPHEFVYIARAYMDFLGIHPFAGSCAATGCALQSLLLMQHGYPAIALQPQDIKRHNLCLQVYFSGGDTEPMAVLVGEYVMDEMNTQLGLGDKARRG